MAKYFLSGVASLVGLLVLFTALFYVPPVQRAVVKTACSFVSDSTMQVSVGDFRLRFPLCLDLSDVCVITEGDTMCALQSLHLEVAGLSLLHLTATVPELSLKKVLFHYADTTGFQMGVRLDEASITSVSAKLLDESAEIGCIALSGGDVNMHLGLPDSATVTEPTDESEPLAWRFDVERLSATDVLFRMSGAYEESLLSAGADVITVAQTSVDLGQQTVDVDSLCLHTGNVSMLSDTTVVVPTGETDEIDEGGDETPSLPWTIRANGIRIDDTDIVYGQMGYCPQPGFDAGYISISSLSVALDSVYNCGTDMAARLAALSFDERSGLSVRNGSAFLSMDSTALQVDGFRLETAHSLLSMDVLADGSLLSMAGDAGLDVSIDWKIGLSDVVLFVPTLDSMLSTLPFNAVSGALKIGGTLENLSVQKFYTELPQTADFRLEGEVQSLTVPDSLRAKMNFMAHLDRLDFLPEWIG
ncbi:MAG: hypothetical protein LUI04_06580 [Porphyromonadaceae bacterium]|nr:hypothetical protein [Porphyromonadaceae bacterium]